MDCGIKPVVYFVASLLDRWCSAVISCDHFVGHLVDVVNDIAVCRHVRQQGLQSMHTTTHIHYQPDTVLVNQTSPKVSQPIIYQSGTTLSTRAH